MALEDALLDILACPIDKRGLLYFADDAMLYNPRLRLRYRIQDGVPLMLGHQAEPVPAEEHHRLMTCARRGEVTAITAGQTDILADDRPLPEGRSPAWPTSAGPPAWAVARACWRWSARPRADPEPAGRRPRPAGAAPGSVERTSRPPGSPSPLQPPPAIRAREAGTRSGRAR
jgi:uncharacterized protein YbaR (Trm112 family)